MILSVEEIIRLVRDSVRIDNEEVEDPVYLAMTDEDILLYVKMGVNRLYPDVESLDELTSDCSEYAVILLTKIELYLKLAVTRAEKVNMSADGASLSLEQRFNHYMSLVEMCRALYNNWLDNEGEGKVQTYELLNSRYSNTKRNYALQQTPKVSIKISDITSDSFNITYGMNDLSKFGLFSVYVSTFPIVNQFKAESSAVEDSIDSQAQLLRTTYDPRNCHKAVSGLDPETVYYIAVIAKCSNGVWGYKEVSVTTLEKFEDSGEEVDVDFNNPTETGSDTTETDLETDSEASETGSETTTDSDTETEQEPENEPEEAVKTE